MIIEIDFSSKKYNADLAKPLDISIPINEGQSNPNCYYAEPIRFETITAGNFVGSVKLGGSVNYQKLTITPHGNGTHTECFGHISSDGSATINNCMDQFHFVSQVISVEPEATSSGDLVVMPQQLSGKLLPSIKALIIRTIPNPIDKKLKQYSGTNPPYLNKELVESCVNHGVDHLLVDLPSVDREVDGGALDAHKSFWNYPDNTRRRATITELIFVPDGIQDGLYLLNLQITSLEMDASPSKPVLYKLE